MLPTKIYPALSRLVPSVFSAADDLPAALCDATQRTVTNIRAPLRLGSKNRQVGTASSGHLLASSSNPAVSTLTRLTRTFANPLGVANPSRPMNRSERIESNPIYSFATDASNGRQGQTQCFVPTADEQQELQSLYGRDAVRECLNYDTFRKIDELRRHLSYIHSQATISLCDYGKIQPFKWMSNFSSTLFASSLECGDSLPDQFCRIKWAILNTPQTKIIDSTCGNGIFSFSVESSFGLPTGWKAEDTFTQPKSGFYRLGTTLHSPDGGAGRIERSFDGRMLSLEEAYNCTLPTSLDGIPGINRRIPTMNFMTARACKILGVTRENLSEIRISRLQHRPTLAHLDWMQRKYPDQNLETLFDHTTWSKTHIKNTARIIGHTLLPCPAINLQGSEPWRMTPQHAKIRNWDFFQAYTERCTVMYLTGQELPKVDDHTQDWREAAKLAVENYKAKCCVGLTSDEAHMVTQNIDRLLTKKYTAIAAEESAVRQRYDLPDESAPQNINFDVIYKTRKHPRKQVVKNFIAIK